MAKFKVSDKVTIVKNVAGHNFTIGTKVYIDRTDTNIDGTTILAHYCLPIGSMPEENYLNDDGWWCEEQDLEACAV